MFNGAAGHLLRCGEGISFNAKALDERQALSIHGNVLASLYDI